MGIRYAESFRCSIRAGWSVFGLQQGNACAERARQPLFDEPLALLAAAASEKRHRATTQGGAQEALAIFYPYGDEEYAGVNRVR